VDIVMPDWPTQTGTVRGRVTDPDGQDMDAFIVIIGNENWPKVGTTDLQVIDNWQVRGGFTNGRFELKDVPIGSSKLRVTAPQRSKYPGMMLGQVREIIVQRGQVLDVEFQFSPQPPPQRIPGRPGGGSGRPPG
jgi:hypothetical protein